MHTDADSAGQTVDYCPNCGQPKSEPRPPAIDSRPLPTDECWSAGTLSYLRRSLLQELRRRGSCTVADFTANRPEVLGLALADAEIHALLDSARRLGLIRMVSDGRGLDGRFIEPEWTLTERGRLTAPRLTSWFLNSMGSLSRVLFALLSLVVGLVALFGLTFHVRSLTQVLHFARSEAVISWYDLIALAFCGACVLAVLHKSGLPDRPEVRADWPRYADWNPQWREHRLPPFPWAWAILAWLAYVAADGLLYEKGTRVVHLPTPGVITEAILASVAALVGIKVVRWTWRVVEMSDLPRKGSSSTDGPPAEC